MTNLYNELEKLLAGNDQYMSEDGTLMKNRVVEAGLALQPDLIRLLLTHDGLKRNFFTELDAMLIFDKVKFQKFVMNKRFLPDSYTSFKNKIGLVGDEGDFLAESREVVLSFPYKDCVLEGGQTKEDAKRNEVFWNEILAPDEITRLTEPKVLTNFKRFTAEGEKEVGSLKLNDNLIIKGNNLLALHTLKQKYAGQVKLIYIDPPYNTGNDSFQYNDSFNHSSWLTFMRNRLTVARELLKDDGVIFIQCDDNEQAYLKVIMDEIFERANFISTIAIRSSTPSGTKTAHKDKTIIKQKDFLLFYAKNSNQVKLNPQYTRRERWDTHYSLWLTKIGTDYTLSKLTDILKAEKLLDDKQKLEDLNINDKLFRTFYLKNSDKIVRLQSHKNKVAEKKSREQKDIVYSHFENGVDKGLYFNGQVITPLTQGVKEVYYNQTITEDLSILLCDFWSDIDFQNTQNEGGVVFPTAKKPEVLMYRLINLTTSSNDIVLDYHLGSGTTAAVAHKMGRRYIGIEQMDYIETVAVERLKKVVGTRVKDGMFDKLCFDEGGISKAVNWQGGGEFVYCELAMANQRFVEAITACATKEGLLAIWQQMQESGFLSWKVEPKQIDENANELMELSIADMQKFLIECLDKNMLYIPYSEIDNQEFGVSDADKKVNKAWYNKQ